MQYGVREKMIRRVGAVEVKCYKCREMEHKCKECPLWEKKERVARTAKLQKTYQKRELAHPMKKKVQEEERRLRRTEEEEVVRVAKP